MSHPTLSKTTTLSGGCACGAIRYTATASPLMIVHCHCRDCQRSSGGPFSAFVVLPKVDVSVTQGTPRFHASPSEAGGWTRRGFCADCGSPLLSQPDAVPHLVAIRTASLDDPNGFPPQADVWTVDALPWDHPSPGTRTFEKYPS